MKTLSHKLIITKVPYVSRYAADDQTKTLSVLMNHKECMEISCDIEEERSLIGNIYVGKVQNVITGLQSAFVNIGEKRTAFIHAKDILPKIDITKEQKERIEEMLGGE